VEDLWIQVLVPLVILMIMTSMGLELTLADFQRIARTPKPVSVGLAGQIVMLPLLGIGFATLTGVRSELALGIVILSACPGGAPSNIFSYLAGANLALSISLTALSSLISVFTIPFWINFGLARFEGPEAELHLPLLRTFAQLIATTVLPVAMGMGLRAKFPDGAARLRPHLKRAMTVLFVAATVLIVASQRETMLRDLPVAAPSAVLLVILAITGGFVLAKTFRLDRRDAFTVSIEVGLQNGALATMIAVNVLARPELVVFPGAYVLLAFIPVGLWTIAFRMRRPASEA
jgi:BASS family bile acid:Na+ symporter